MFVESKQRCTKCVTISIGQKIKKKKLSNYLKNKIKREELWIPIGLKGK